ncbi:hypothetical protein HO133_001291 [Letharia lupina]|uniref:Uncharacterized protein n=1 Tax=Letharia lupina TaxID=560253 RepID=A0A8H6CF25_9LECA|nr:uncharacterized protein HO133_001291 [Letharia lupina]KAF6222205.1 hypothetical protein HO133_001291 [Letharia lupina]
MTNPPPTLLTLPVEIRSSIFYLALLNTPEVCAPEPPYRHSLDLSLLSTNRQVYYETRTIPLALHHFGNQYDPQVNFLSSLRLRPFQIAALKILVIESLFPGHLTHFLALGNDNGYLFGEEALGLDLLVIYAEDWIGKGARRWRYTASPEDVHYNLPMSSRWLRALCGLKGWNRLEIVLGTRDLVNEYWDYDRFMQTLFDDFRSRLGDLDEGFTIWHEGRDVPSEKIVVLRTRELGRYKQTEWWRADVGRLMDGSECVLRGSMDINEDDGGGRPGFHVQERCGVPENRKNHCTRCQPGCGCYTTQR